MVSSVIMDPCVLEISLCYAKLHDKNFRRFGEKLVGGIRFKKGFLVTHVINADGIHKYHNKNGALP